MFQNVKKSFDAYKYRFVPWLIWNWSKGVVKHVTVNENVTEVIDVRKDHLRTVMSLFEKLTDCSLKKSNRLIIESELGFMIERKKSHLSGHGVFVTSGNIKAGSLVAFYPGTVYYPMEPLFFQSLGNSFILKCVDGIMIDGNDKRMSKWIYRSSAARDTIGSYQSCDTSWLTNQMDNPLAIGQYINNGTKMFPANVMYEELDIPLTFPLSLMKYIPNVNFSPLTLHTEDESGADSHNGRFVRTVVIVSLRDIDCGEELFSSYFTEVKNET